MSRPSGEPAVTAAVGAEMPLGEQDRAALLLAAAAAAHARTPGAF